MKNNLAVVNKTTPNSKTRTVKYDTVEGSEVQKTHEYNVFTKDARNRPVHPDKVNTFVREFKKGNFFMHEFPAVVNEDFVILDGQHRYEACKALNLPFYFRFTNLLKFDNIVDIQSNAGWHVTDFIHAYVNQNKPDYVVLQRFMTRYDFSATLAAHMLTNSKGVGLKKSGFYDGNFKVRNEAKAHDIAKLLTELNEFMTIKTLDKAFGMAILTIYDKAGFNRKRMIEQMRKYSGLMRPQVSMNLFIRNLEEVYNYRLAAKNKVRFI